MVMMNNMSIINAREASQDRWRKMRADNAAAFNAYVQQQTTMGRKVSPQELDQYRMQLSGGNSYLMGGIPGQVILDDVARQQHIQAQQAQTTALAAQAEEQQKIRAQLSQIIPIDAPLDKVQEIVFKTYGESAPQVWGMYEHDIPNMQDERVIQRAETLFHTERMNDVRAPEDVPMMFPGESPRVHAKLAEMTQVRAANTREAGLGRAIEGLGRVPPDVLSRSTPESRENLIRAIARANGLGDPSADEMEHMLGITEALGGAATNMRTEIDNRAFNDTLWQHLTDHMRSGGTLGEEDILNVARRSAASHGINIETKEDLEKRLGTDMQRWIQAESYRHSWGAQYEAEAMRASTMVQMEVEHEKVRVTTDYGNAVTNRSLREGSHAHSALLALTEQGQFLSRGDTQEHIEFATQAEKRGGLTPDQIRAALIEEYGVRTPGEMAEIAAMSAMDRAGFGPPPGTSMANQLQGIRTSLDERTEALLNEMVTLPIGPEREARLALVSRQMQNIADRLRGYVRNRQGHPGFTEFSSNEVIDGMPWVVAAEEAANRIEEQILELRQEAGRIEYNPETSGTQDADELMQGGGEPSGEEEPSGPVAPRSHGRSRGASPHAFEQSPVYDLLYRSRNEREAMLQQRMAPQTPDWDLAPDVMPDVEPRMGEEPEPQSLLESPYRRVGSIPNNDAVVAAADVAHRFESLYGQVGDRPNSEFVGEFQMGKAKRDELGLTEQQAKDPVMARYAYERWAYQRAIPSLQEAGIPASPVSIYLTWQQGVRGFRDIYQTAQSDLPPSAARQRNMDNNRPPAGPDGKRLPKGATAREWLAAWERAIRTHKATDRHQEALRQGTTRQA